MRKKKTKPQLLLMDPQARLVDDAADEVEKHVIGCQGLKSCLKQGGTCCPEGERLWEIWTVLYKDYMVTMKEEKKILIH